MVKIKWTPVAVEDLKEIHAYIALDSKRYAQITVAKIHFRVYSLAEQPMIGRIVPEIEDQNIRELISGNYRIIYMLKSEDAVDILRIFHSARDLKKENI